jgi:hypothetical protein
MQGPAVAEMTADVIAGTPDALIDLPSSIRGEFEEAPTNESGRRARSRRRLHG